MIALLDVNVLIALVDPNHRHHQPAQAFFKSAMPTGWATCPLTENGFLRIMGSRSYPMGPGSPEAARRLLGSYVGGRGHQFWADDISLFNLRTIKTLPEPGSLTDLYLLALAHKHGGRLVTFDQKIDVMMVKGAHHSLEVLAA
jgi:uncharacterized protein